MSKFSFDDHYVAEMTAGAQAWQRRAEAAEQRERELREAGDRLAMEVERKLGWIKRDLREPDKVFGEMGSIRFDVTDWFLRAHPEQTPEQARAALELNPEPPTTRRNR